MIDDYIRCMVNGETENHFTFWHELRNAAKEKFYRKIYLKWIVSLTLSVFHDVYTFTIFEFRDHEIHLMRNICIIV